MSENTTNTVDVQSVGDTQQTDTTYSNQSSNTDNDGDREGATVAQGQSVDETTEAAGTSQDPSPDDPHPIMGKVIDHPNPKAPMIAVLVDQSVTDDHIKCKICGNQYQRLSRHLKAAHGTSFEQYRERFKLGEDYPEAAVNAKQGGRPRKDAAKDSSGKPEAVTDDDDADDGSSGDDQGMFLLACANENDLPKVYRNARDGFTRLDIAVRGLLHGRSDFSRRAFALGYGFARDCVKYPEAAAELPQWDRAKVKDGTNPFYQPVKLLTLEVCNQIKSEASRLAATYQDADEKDFTLEEYEGELKRRHVRKWYDELPKPPKVDGNVGDDHGTGVGNGGQEDPVDPNDDTNIDGTDGNALAPSLQPERVGQAEAAALLNSMGFGNDQVSMSIEEARELLAEQGYQTGPDRMSLEEARNLFRQDFVILLWKRDELEVVRRDLEKLPGYGGTLLIPSDAVADLVDRSSRLAK